MVGDFKSDPRWFLGVPYGELTIFILFLILIFAIGGLAGDADFFVY